ncbi:hypothetical protein VNO77_25981 [Canavalia gladiata]|uniref:Uncharacterized protein n=1 Tax=Canavalia gladiata TaxID=3824 RepID=A0AAN9Q990_CANGL
METLLAVVKLHPRNGFIKHMAWRFATLLPKHKTLAQGLCMPLMQNLEVDYKTSELWQQILRRREFLPSSTSMELVILL